MMASAFVVIAAGVLALVVALVVSASARADGRDVAWIAGEVFPPAEEARVYARYLTRHRRHRVVGGVFGACVAVVVGVRWYGSVTVGVGNGNPAADLLLCTLSGVVLGALSAETYRLRQPRVTVASLRGRAPLPRAGVVRASWVVTGTAIVAGALLAAAGDGTVALVAAAIGGVTVLVGQATRRAIRDRARPVLSDRAAHVDARMRAFAGESVAWLQLAAAVLTAAWVASQVPTDAGVATIAVLGGLVVVVVLLRRARPRPSRSWQPGFAA